MKENPGICPKLAIVIPSYNEEEVIYSTATILTGFLNELKARNLIDDNSFLCFVDDGSRDKTVSILKDFKQKDTLLKIVKLSRNFGHQSALLAGLSYVKDCSDCCVTLDADLQDDFTVIEEMVKNFAGGAEVVYGVRNKRDKDTLFKRYSAELFYWLMNFLGASTLRNHADFRLLSSRAVDFLLDYTEVNMFLRGIVPLFGLKSEIVYYERKERTAGETKYPFRKMIAFAIEGITSFSVKPLRVVTFLGGIMILVTMVIGIYILISTLGGRVVQGWTSLIVSIWFLGGVQLFCLGILGEYIGKIYKEAKKRPRFLTEEII